MRQAARGSPKRWVPKWVHRVQKKLIFFNKDPGPHGMPKQVLLARFELMVARFGPSKIPKCLENGLFWDKKKGSKMGQKCVFPKMILHHLQCLNK